jgi:glycosyltransferase involved in cell wall biosynthesis
MTNSRHLLHLFSTFAAGGPQARTAVVLRSLDDSFRHTIVALDGDLAGAKRLEDHPRVAFADPPKKSRWGAALPRFAKLIRGVAPDLLLTYNWGAIEAIPAARLAGVRRIIHAEDGFGPEEAGGQLRRRVWFRRLVLPLARKVVVPSLVLEGHLRHTWRVPARARVVIRNGIDLDHFAPIEAAESGGRSGDGAAARARRDGLRAQWGARAGECVIGTVARLRAEKGLDLLIEGFATLLRSTPFAANRATTSGAVPTPRLVLVGDGAEEAMLRALAKRLGVAERVHFAGALADPREACRAFDLFAMSSRTEQMPIALLEAMGCGLAVVSTAVGDVATMVAPENLRFLRPDREPAPYAAALAELAADPALRAAVGAANRRRALAEFDEAAMVRRYRELYLEVLAS